MENTQWNRRRGYLQDQSSWQVRGCNITQVKDDALDRGENILFSKRKVFSYSNQMKNNYSLS